MDPLDPVRTEQVLERIGAAAPPTIDLDGLTATYVAWCRSISFDNVIKRIHLASGSSAPLPNTEPAAFFDLWLRHGTGGTCWPSSAALGALLSALGFEARLGSCAMLDQALGAQPTHGTVLVRLEGVDHWVDSSMLTEHPLPLRPGATTRHEHPVHPMEAEPVGRAWRVWFSAPRTDPPPPGLMHCLLLDDDVTLDHYRARYEWSRAPDRSIFNQVLNAGRCGADEHLGYKWSIRGDTYTRRRADGTTREATVSADERRALLVDRYGYSEEIVARIPPDER